MDPRLILFKELYDAHADAIFRYLYLNLKDRERAIELTQEVFMKTWQYLLRGEKIEHEKAFLYRIAKNLFINEIRTDRRTASLEVLEIDGFDMQDELTGNTAAEHRELQDRLQMLNESYRTVLLLRYKEGLPIKDIAKILGENETNISMRINRGIKALRKAYRIHHEPR